MPKSLLENLKDAAAKGNCHMKYEIVGESPTSEIQKFIYI